MDSGFDKIRRNKCTLFINRHLRNDDLEQALLAGEKTLQGRYHLTPVFSSDTSRVHKFTVRFTGVERWVYIKQYLCRSVWDFIKHLVRPSRARRAFKATLMLEKNGFEAPAVVAMGECKSGLFNREDFLVTFEVENAQRFHQIIPERLEDLSKEQLRNKRELMRAFGQSIGKMHAAGIFHGDLRVGNVLARQKKNDWHFFFIDNERTKKFYRLPPWLRLKNLVQLNMFRDGISRTDRLRFFKTYVCSNPSVQRCSNKWIQKVVTKTNLRFKKREKSFNCR